MEAGGEKGMVVADWPRVSGAGESFRAKQYRMHAFQRDVREMQRDMTGVNHLSRDEGKSCCRVTGGHRA